jgi:hypothetical protein
MIRKHPVSTPVVSDRCDTRDGVSPQHHSVDYWRKEAEHATLNLRVVQQLTKDVLTSQHQDVDVDSIAKNIVECMEREWDERERVLRAEYEVKLCDVEERYKRDLVQLVEESKRLDSALLCIKGLCDAQEENGSDGIVSGRVSLDVETIAEHEYMMRSQEEKSTPRHCLDDSKVHPPVLSEDDGKIESCTVTSSSVDGDGEMDSSVMYARAEDGKELHLSNDSFCPVVAYRGEDPDVLTENAMDRILDHPGRMYRGSAYKAKYGEGKYASLQTWRIPSLETRTLLVKEIQELETKLKKKVLCDSVESKEDTKIDVVEEDEFVRTIQALGQTSPTTTGLMIQHVSDSWAVQKHAGKDVDVNTSGTKTAAATKKSGKKSSFLGRQPISLNQVFSSGPGMWAYN